MKEQFPKSTDIKPELPGYRGRIHYFGKERIPIHLDEHNWEFKTKEGIREIPVMSVWSPKNRKKIAEAIIDKKRIAMYMWGSFGTGYLMNFPEWQKKNNDEARDLREKLKIGRPKNMSFPIIVHPDDEWMFWDFDQLHPDLRYLRNATKRHNLYNSGPVHIIAPTKTRNSYLDESAKWPLDNTACYYYMPHPAWQSIIEDNLRKYVKHSIFEGGSLNPYQVDPVYTTSGLYSKIQETPQWTEGIDLVAICEISEYFQIYRGQTQIRLAQKGSNGISEVIRPGSMSHKRWSNEQNIRVELREGVKGASSLWPYSEDINNQIDKKVLSSMETMNTFERVDAKFLRKAA